jgi:hypothetical protein
MNPTSRRGGHERRKSTESLDALVQRLREIRGALKAIEDTFHAKRTITMRDIESLKRPRKPRRHAF